MSRFVLAIMAILLRHPWQSFLTTVPPKHLVINILLCLVMYVPGIFHALWMVLR
jgi:uncharacterized membrane protein YqaE (UPF0057 family)